MSMTRFKKNNAANLRKCLLRNDLLRNGLKFIPA